MFENDSFSSQEVHKEHGTFTVMLSYETIGQLPRYTVNEEILVASPCASPSWLSALKIPCLCLALMLVFTETFCKGSCNDSIAKFNTTYSTRAIDLAQE